MSAENAEPKGTSGDGNGKDDTLAKVTGVVIATGIGYSLYKSVFVGKKTEKPLGEPFNGYISIKKPHGEFDAKGKANDRFSWFWKPDTTGIEQQGKNVKNMINKSLADTKGKVDEIVDKLGAGLNKGKESVVEGKDFVVNEGIKAKEAGVGWFQKTFSQADKEKEEVAIEVDQAKVSGKKVFEDSNASVSKEGEKAKESGFNWFRNITSTADVEKEKVEAEKAKESAKESLEADKEHLAKEGGKAKETGFGWFRKFTSQPVKEKEEGSVGISNTQGQVYGIRPGDTLWSIADKFGVSVEKLKIANEVWDPDYIVAGDRITIPK